MPMTILRSELDAVDARLRSLPPGHFEAVFGDRRYGVTLNASPDTSRRWLFAEELGGADRISCNLYRLGDGRLVLRPCEMPADKVIRFVLGLAVPNAVPVTLR